MATRTTRLIGTVGKSQGHLPTPRKPPHPKRGPGTRPPVDSPGILISIGPIDDDDLPNHHIRAWMTFPVTPESIPKQVAANYLDGIYPIEGDERSTYIGAQLTRMTFSGRLEPPRFYFPTERKRHFKKEILAGEPSLHGGSDDIDTDTAQFTRAYDVSKSIQVNRIPSYLVPYYKGGTSVVMEDGAHAGPSHFFEPHLFSEILELACNSGEVFRLVIGDQYGWNFPATIRDYTPRFEDPDPDVLLFDISFAQHRRHRVLAAQQGKGKTKKGNQQGSVVTRDGDTLHSIALRELGTSEKWTTLARLNRKTISKLWYYARLKSIGPHVSGEHGHKLGDGHISPTMLFRHGVTLRLRPPEKPKHKGKGKG